MSRVQANPSESSICSVVRSFEVFNLFFLSAIVFFVFFLPVLFFFCNGRRGTGCSCVCLSLKNEKYNCGDVDVGK